MTSDIVERLREPLVIEFAVPPPVHEVLQRAADEREESAKTIEFLRGLIAELEARVAEDDARWSQITVSAASADTRRNGGDAKQAPLVSGAVGSEADETPR